MPNYNQAPSIKYIGNKLSDEKKWGYAKRSHELETAIMCGLGERDMAMLKIMLFLTGNAEGFQVAEATICERCNISSTGYKKARKKLADMGWIHINAKDNTIEIDYDAILKKKQGVTENTSISNQEKKQGLTQLTSSTEQGLTENTPSEKIGVNSEYVYFEGVHSVPKQGLTQFTPQGVTQFTHNNIKEQDKVNTIKVSSAWCVANGEAYSGRGKVFMGKDGKWYEIDNENGLQPEKEGKWIYDF